MDFVFLTAMLICNQQAKIFSNLKQFELSCNSSYSAPEISKCLSFNMCVCVCVCVCVCRERERMFYAKICYISEGAISRGG